MSLLPGMWSDLVFAISTGYTVLSFQCMDDNSITEPHCFLAYLTTLDKYFTVDLQDIKIITLWGKECANYCGMALCVMQPRKVRCTNLTSLSVLQAHIRLILPATSMEVALAGGCLTGLNYTMSRAVKSLIDPNWSGRTKVSLLPGLKSTCSWH